MGSIYTCTPTRTVLGKTGPKSMPRCASHIFLWMCRPWIVSHLGFMMNWLDTSAQASSSLIFTSCSHLHELLLPKSPPWPWPTKGSGPSPRCCAAKRKRSCGVQRRPRSRRRSLPPTWMRLALRAAHLLTARARRAGWRRRPCHQRHRSGKRARKLRSPKTRRCVCSLSLWRPSTLLNLGHALARLWRFSLLLFFCSRRTSCGTKAMNAARPIFNALLCN